MHITMKELSNQFDIHNIEIKYDTIEQAWYIKNNNDIGLEISWEKSYSGIHKEISTLINLMLVSKMTKTELTEIQSGTNLLPLNSESEQ